MFFSCLQSGKSFILILVDEQNKKKEKKNSSLTGALLVLCIIIIVVIQIYESDKYPKLSDFGLKTWSIQCADSHRAYRLLSEVYFSHNSSKPKISDRGLDFLDQNNSALYHTRMFDKSSLDNDGVWRFRYRKWDVRLFAKKDSAKVLKGDEKTFEIAEDFKSMTVLTQTGQRLELPCQQLAI